MSCGSLKTATPFLLKSMNIFILDENPELASQYHVDKHIVKMPLETAQLLCTSHWLTGGEAPYKPSHAKHPCNLWLLKSKKNYEWLVNFGLELCKEYTHRYKKYHKCEEIINWCKNNTPNLPDVEKTEYPLAMPDVYKTQDAIQSYRNYYIFDKKHLHRWSNRNTPNWII